MKRIILMVLKRLLIAPFWFFQICWYGRSDKYTEEQRYALLKKVTTGANKSGRVKIDVYGTENLPKENGFIYYPNHQGLFDVLAIIEASPRPFGVVMKKEVSETFLVKQVRTAMRGMTIDRKDIRQSMEVILKIAEEVKYGRNYLIFSEGTRSREGNKLLPFKGGSFKSATKAKCPIVPVALIDAYQAFDTNSIKPMTVQVHFLTPILYEEYKNWKTTEIAEEVHRRIEKTIEKYDTSSENA